MRKNRKNITRKIKRAIRGRKKVTVPKKTLRKERKERKNKTQEKTQRANQKNNQKNNRKKTKIIDIPFSRKKHLGTLASSDEINYKYQSMSNMCRFLEILKTKGEIKDVALWPNTPDEYSDNYSLLKVDLDGLLGKLKDAGKTKVTPWFYTQAKYKKEFKLRKARFVPIIIISIGELMKNQGHPRHANILLIDNERKVIEFFEPHGYKKDFSTPSDPVTQYHKKDKALRDFWKKIIPKYEFINASDILGKRGYQTKYDRGTGYCTVWSTLFAHYRLLNPDTPLEDLMAHIDKKIKVTNLLKYARYIEDTLKQKI